MKNIALIFPGYGAQFPGMCKSLCTQYRLASDTLDEASDIMKIDMKRLCFDENMMTLSRYDYAHLAIVVTSMALFRVYMEEIGIKPQFLAGHSLGQYAALACAKAYRFQDILEIIKYRGELLLDAVGSKESMMIVNNCHIEQLEELCYQQQLGGQQVAISNYNGKQQVALSGPTSVLKEMAKMILREKMQPNLLLNSVPIHSQWMLSQATKLRYKLSQYTVQDYKYKVICNTSGNTFLDKENLQDSLFHHMIKPVKWILTMDCFQKNNIDTIIEMGGQNILRNLARQEVPHIESYSFGQLEDRKHLLDQKAYRDNPKKKDGLFYKIIGDCLTEIICTKNNNNDERLYQEGVIKPYEDLEEMLQSFEDKKDELKITQVYKALDLLTSILIAKKRTQKFCEEVINRILFGTGIEWRKTF